LIPDGSNWKATMLIEYPDEAERRRMLGLLRGIEKRVWSQVAGSERVYAIADEDLERENDEKTSSVHFLRFELAAPMRAALARGAGLSMGVDHPQYRVGAEVPGRDPRCARGGPRLRWFLVLLVAGCAPTQAGERLGAAEPPEPGERRHGPAAALSTPGRPDRVLRRPERRIQVFRRRALTERRRRPDRALHARRAQPERGRQRELRRHPLPSRAPALRRRACRGQLERQG